LGATLPWLVAEVEATRALMGDDYWPYGLEPNRAALSALVRYNFDQGLAARQSEPDELFVPSTLDEFRI
jgi:4,5-dihydroxyphthalate decarboxylase